jgi:tRNA-uridine 2-sulfurtransferase
MKKRVFVGMSGGVDSSLSAALLVEQGYDVTGVYMKNWTENLPGMKCPWAEDLADAKRVAVRLGIDFKVYDFQLEYKQQVVDYMIDAYRQGLTPNPDIMCNQEVKFKLFLDSALRDGADMIATGHYARVGDGNWYIVDGKQEFKGNSYHIPNTTYYLRMAADSKKDQTYFLYRITAEALSRTLFPIGEYDKPTVRKMAAERGLSTAAKKDSQGICFVGQIGIRDFLSAYVEHRPGGIVDRASGKVVGSHDGAIFYTIGQRHGLDVGGGLPFYVVGKDMDKNEVYVTTNLNDQALWKTDISIVSVRWINSQPPEGDYKVRLRHRGALIDARLEYKLDSTVLHLQTPERAIAPGQSAVVYEGETCLGGGVIV